MIIGKSLRIPQKRGMFFKAFFREINDLGVNSFGLVVFTSVFVGAVVAIQMYNNFASADIPIPTVYVGFATKAVLVLEFSPTIISLVLAGKVGSYIASSIGTMRVSEQIDALDIMGVNSPNFLILPKIFASIIFNPLLIALSIVFGIGVGISQVSLQGIGLRESILRVSKDICPTCSFTTPLPKRWCLHLS